MTPQRIFGMLMLVAGVILLVTGMNSSHSIADQVSNTFTGRFTQATTWYIIGGIGAGIVGVFLLVGGQRGKTL
jgi:hypothetical protein